MTDSGVGQGVLTAVGPAAVAAGAIVLPPIAAGRGDARLFD
jgi:hypothetical protein